ncbi:MAG: 3-oxoacyl-[acyl-carrier-protein] reductase [Pseudopedobacter sp.]|nr:3-oxoacyl-[acyl-carrier-protein] reductase [Deinococcales bacterium]
MVNIQNALVTGSSRGLGRAIALELGRAGYRVAVHYAGRKSAAQDVATEIRSSGGQASVFGADLSDRAAASSLVNRVILEFGSLEVLVNNAGITKDGLLIRMKDEDWDSVLRTNLDSAFYTCRAAIKNMMRARYGRIVNVSSIVGVQGNPGQVNYVASKAGLIGLSKALAKEYGSRGITVNAIAPGFIESDMTAELPEKVRAAYLEGIPAGRFGKPEEVAATVRFLCSSEAGYLNGQVIGVDGGM